MPVLIDPPAPPLPPNGLLTAAVGPLPMPAHATIDGLQYVLDTCGTADVLPIDCDEDLAVETWEASDGVLSVTPFAVIATSVCGKLGTSVAETEARVRRRLQLKEQWAVERAFWGGTADLPGYLQALGAVELPDAATVTAGLAALEQAIADDYGLPGLVHVRPLAVAYLADAGLLRYDGTTLKTYRGNVVVVGDGYGGQGPGGEAVASGSEWMFATGRVVVWRDDVFVPPINQTFSRSNNQQQALALRTYMLGVECFAAAVNVTLGG